MSFENVKYISEEDFKQINTRSKVDIGDILFAMIGSIGNPVMVASDKPIAIKNVALFKYHNNVKYVKRFLLIYLQSCADDMRKNSQGGVQSFVSLSYIRNYPFPLPPLAEQERIVARVDELMALVDRLEALQERADAVGEQVLAGVVG